MAKANKTRWSEKWLVGGAVQEVRLRIVEDKNYNESTIVWISPIEDFHEMITLPRNETGGVGLLVK